ncbi:MAG TPA: oligosaccharide flippase family protein [Candidatus Nanoarchaeia archaeon]|nr:oligosaccharide flippase family protein [Candidatus Nanoarchaeia archaeon]
MLPYQGVNLTEKKLALGTIYMMIAGMVFMLSNYIINIGVAHFLNTELYGLFGIVMSFNYINWVFLNAAPLAASRFIAEAKYSFYSIYVTALKLQAILALLFFLFYLVAAKYLAALLSDSSLVYYLLAVGIIILPNAFLTLYLDGFFNGLRLYQKRSWMNSLFSIFKVLFTFPLIFLGYKLYGVLAGYFLAMLCALLLCITNFKVKAESPPSVSIPPVEMKKIIYFALPIIIATLAFTLMKTVSVLFIKYFLQDNVPVAFFTVASTISNIPYTLLTAVPFTILPSISKSVGENNLTLTRKYIQQSLRYLLLLALPLTALIMATAANLIDIFYPETYLSAGPILEILILSFACIIAYHTLRSVIIGAGKPQVEMYISLFSLVVLCLASWLMIPSSGTIGAAWASLVGSALALVVGAFYVYRKFQVLINPLSLVRIGVCSLIIFILAHFWQYSGILLLLNYGLLFLFYLVLLHLFGEITAEDITLCRNSFNRLFKKDSLRSLYR